MTSLMHRGHLGAAFALVAAFAPAAAASPDPRHALFERLSISLNGRRLSRAELEEVERRLAAEPTGAVYQELIERWLTADNVRGLLGPLLINFKPLEGFFTPLIRDDGEGYWYLPHQDPAGCAPAERVSVVPWWDRQPIAICAKSYRPEVTFDDAGFCAGQVTVPEPLSPRPTCGCGPLLLSCAPADLGFAFFGMLIDEYLTTAVDLVMRDRPFDELLTTTRTWQTGVIEFLYLRQRMLAMLRHQPYSPQIERELRHMLATIDAAAPGRFVTRSGRFIGSGVYTTPGLSYGLLRANIVDLFNRVLCVEFESVHVDSGTILETFGGPGAVGVAERPSQSPMRHQEGCSGCHRPLDETAGFQEGVTSGVYGAMFTGLGGAGKLFLKGAQDYRGEGIGMAALMQLIKHQPEYLQCVTRNTYRALSGREPDYHQRRELAGLEAGFEASGRRLRWLIQAILTHPLYTGPVEGLAQR
jgi:hypothetical protein